MTENGVSHAYHTLRFGGFDPDTALRFAQQYAEENRASVMEALLLLTTDMEISSSDSSKKILVSGDPDMTKALSSIFHHCPAVAAQLTFDADCGQTAVEYNPLWLELC